MKTTDGFTVTGMRDTLLPRICAPLLIASCVIMAINFNVLDALEKIGFFIVVSVTPLLCWMALQPKNAVLYDENAGEIVLNYAFTRKRIPLDEIAFAEAERKEIYHRHATDFIHYTRNDIKPVVIKLKNAYGESPTVYKITVKNSTSVAACIDGLKK